MISQIAHSKPYITQEDIESVDKVLVGVQISQGLLVRQFEHEVAEYLNVHDGVSTASGTAALHLALLALGFIKGKEVIMPTYVCKSVAEAIMSVGLIPIYCDVDEQWSMTVESVEQVFSKNTCAIIIVHIFGIPVDVQSFQQFNVLIIEDSCQSFGARVNMSACGTVGDIGFYSFHATKCLTTGEGGFVVSRDGDFVDRLRNIRDGSYPESPRLASPMSDIQAALGLSQLRRYDTFLARRKYIAGLYFRRMKNLPIDLPFSLVDQSIFFRFPVKVTGNFEKYYNAFIQQGINVRKGVDRLLHQDGTQSFNVCFSGAEKIFKETISIPIYPALSDDDIERIVMIANMVFAG